MFSGLIQRKFANPAKNFFRRKLNCFRSNSEINEKKYFFVRKNFFLSKQSSALIESSFDKPSEMFLVRVRNWQNRTSNFRKSFRKCSSGHVICSSQNAAESFLANIPAFYAQNLKKTTEFLFFTTLFSSKCSSGLIEVKLGHPAENCFARILLLFCPNSKIHEKYTTLFGRTFF